ncbi:ABC transporter permease [Streptomyces sp. NRRL B-24720]|uniref:ABC transporter permease n=1 Tax=Streptomyces sp. NRRL B-24720 TaxID=1476876 RepID=UPI0004C4F773|nr:ABC transporter permease subunit [Streptomyces sp. NRRL B-24720]
MNGVIRAELLATRKRPGVWVVGGAWAGLSVAFGMVVPYIVWLAIRNRPTGSAGDPEQLIGGILPDKFLSGTVDLYPMFGSALMLILGAVLVGGEYRWGTWGTLLVQGPGRSSAVLGKAMAAAVAVLCVTVLVLAASAGASGLASALTGRPAHWPDAATLLGGIGAVWLISMAAASLGIFLSILLRGTGAAIGVGLLWLLALENLVSGLAGTLPALKWVQRLLIGPSAGSLATALDPSGKPNTSIPGVVSVSGPLSASLILAAYVVVCLGLSCLFVNRRDVT